MFDALTTCCCISASNSLGGNKISGQLPWGHLSQLVGLTHLDISRNFLNSTIGSRVGSLANLVSLQLDNNYRENQDGMTYMRNELILMVMIITGLPVH